MGGKKCEKKAEGSSKQISMGKLSLSQMTEDGGGKG